MISNPAKTGARILYLSTNRSRIDFGHSLIFFQDGTTASHETQGDDTLSQYMSLARERDLIRSVRQRTADLVRSGASPSRRSGCSRHCSYTTYGRLQLHPAKPSTAAPPAAVCMSVCVWLGAAHPLRKSQFSYCSLPKIEWARLMMTLGGRVVW